MDAEWWDAEWEIGRVDKRLAAFLRPRWRHPLAHNTWMWEQIDKLLDERLAWMKWRH